MYYIHAGNNDTEKLKINDIFKKKSRKKECEDKDERSIGDNGVVLRACEMIKGAKNYYYIALLPEKIENLQDKFASLKLNFKVETKNIKCVGWKTIKDFASKNEAIPILENFKFNEAIDKKGNIKSQIYYIDQ